MNRPSSIKPSLRHARFLVGKSLRGGVAQEESFLSAYWNSLTKNDVSTLDI